MRAFFALGLCLFASAALSQDAPIWRCSDGQGGVLYSNQRCAGGMVLDIASTRPDPSAWDRLRREQEAFEARQAAREAARAEDERRRREAEARPPRAEVVEAPSYPAWFYAPMYQPPLPRMPRPPRKPSQGFVPAR